MFPANATNSCRYCIVNLKSNRITRGIVKPKSYRYFNNSTHLSYSYLPIPNAKYTTRALSNSTILSAFNPNRSTYSIKRSNYDESYGHRYSFKRKLHQLDLQEEKKINSLILRDANDWDKLLMMFEQNVDRFAFLNWATFMNRLGKFKRNEISTFKKDKRYKKAVQCMNSIFSSNSLRDISDIRCVANIVHALAKLNEPIQIILDKVEEESEYVINNMKPQELSNVAWSYAILNTPAPKFFRFLENNATRTIKEWSSQSISNVAFAFAKLSIPAPEFFRLIDENASKIIYNGKPQAISNIVWSCAILSIPAPNFFNLVNENASFIIKDGTPQAISNIAWSFAKLHFPAHSFFDLIDKNGHFIIANGKTQHVSNIAWSCATLSISAPTFFMLIERNATRIIKYGKSQEISNIAWSLAKLSVLAPNFFMLVDENATDLVKNGTPQEFSNTVWAFAELKYNSINLLKVIDKECSQLIKYMNPQEIASVALALAKLDFRSHCYFNVLEQNIDKLQSSMNTQVICNILWSLAILDLMDKNKILFNVLWKKVSLLDLSEFHYNELSQLALVCFHAEASSIYLEKLPTPLRNKIEKAEYQKTTMITKSHDEYSKLLYEIGFEHEREVSPCDESSYSKMLLIDCACKDRKIAIELDGSPHFLTDLKRGSSPNTGKKSGRTMAKKRLLERFGWKVISIKYTQDIEMEKRGNDNASELKKEFLKQELCKVGVML